VRRRPTKSSKSVSASSSGIAALCRRRTHVATRITEYAAASAFSGAQRRRPALRARACAVRMARCDAPGGFWRPPRWPGSGSCSSCDGLRRRVLPTFALTRALCT
jgi:hypothetical protein